MNVIAYTADQLQILRQQNQSLTDEEFAYLVEVSKATGLNLFQRQLHGLKRGGRLSIQTGIDGYRLIAARTGVHAGTSDATFQVDDRNLPVTASVTVCKLMPNGAIAQFVATARWNEYAQGNSPMWQKMPYLMLSKCAESLALRKAFPGELSGIYTQEEMMQADHMEVVTHQQPQQPQVEAKQAQQLQAFIEEQALVVEEGKASSKSGAPITAKQLAMISGLWRKVFGDPKDPLAEKAIREHLVFITGKDSRKDLTVSEAGELIESLLALTEDKENG